MSTAAWMAATPSRIWFISRSSGPRTAATMQNSVAPVARVCSAALTSSGMSSHTERTGEVNWPDWLQKWQSSGQPPVLRETIPSTSTSGPHHRMPYLVGQREQRRDVLVREREDVAQLVLVEASAADEDLLARHGKDRRLGGLVAREGRGRRRGHGAPVVGTGPLCPAPAGRLPGAARWAVLPERRQVRPSASPSSPSVTSAILAATASPNARWPSRVRWSRSGRNGSCHPDVRT